MLLPTSYLELVKLSIIYLSSQGNIADFLQRVKNWASRARQKRVWRRLEAGMCSSCPILSLRGQTVGKDDVREWKVGREKHWPGSHFA